MGMYFDYDDCMYGFCLQYEYNWLNNNKFFRFRNQNIRQFVYNKFLYGKEEYWHGFIILGKRIFILLLETQLIRPAIKGKGFNWKSSRFYLIEFVKVSKFNNF
jgi:hypothetical protein